MTMNELHIALITRSLMIGGAQHQIVQLCRNVSENDVRISLFLLVSEEAADLASEVPENVKVFNSPFSHKDPRIVKWLGNHLETQGIQVAHSFLWTSDALASFSKTLFSSTPLICSERGDRAPELGYYSFWRNLYDRLVTFRKADLVCANSNFGRGILVESGCDPEKVRVIHNGVDLDNIDSKASLNLRDLLAWPKNSQIVGMVSRLIWYKGVDFFLRAMATIQDRASIYCLIIGDGPDRSKLEHLAQTLGIPEKVVFLGSHFPAIGYIKDFDVCVLGTHTSEHCSNSILEYMACRKPVVATNVGGNPELIVDQETGLLVEPKNVSSMSQAILKLIDNPSLASRMGTRGRERIENEFNIENMVEKYLSLWQEVASSRIHNCTDY